MSDLFRDTPIRYLGYTNEVGEAFRPLVSRQVVNASYGVATGYVLCDMFYKTGKLIQRGDAKVTTIVTTAGDVFLWQMLASVIIPGITINRITTYSSLALSRRKSPQLLIKVVPTILGLCSIPLIIKPIDHLVDYLLDKTYRKFV